MERTEAIRRGLDFEREIGNLIELAGLQTLPIRTGGLDFQFEDPERGRTAVVVKYSVRSFTPAEVAYAFTAAQEAASSFLFLVTSTQPSAAQRARMGGLVETTGVPSEWVTREGLAAQLGVPADRRQVIQQYGLAAALIQAAPTPREAELRAVGLHGRLPRSAIAVIGDSPLSDFLKIGEQLQDLTFVMSDIKNYSSIVAKARARDIQEAMSEIYRNSREVIRAHGGTLVDFAGDGALAVFDYPVLADGSVSRALLCAADLIEVGRVSLARLFRRMNADLDTGTRIGIASGDVLIVDSGFEEPDPQFVSDAINLAARLQALAPTNGMLMDNLTYGLLEDTDAALLASLNATLTRVPAQDAKGQLVGTVAWTVEEAASRSVAASHQH